LIRVACLSGGLLVAVSAGQALRAHAAGSDGDAGAFEAQSCDVFARPRSRRFLDSAGPATYAEAARYLDLPANRRESGS